MGFKPGCGATPGGHQALLGICFPSRHGDTSLRSWGHPGSPEKHCENSGASGRAWGPRERPVSRGCGDTEVRSFLTP